MYMLKFKVTKLSHGFDFIMKNEWLKKHKAHINYDSKTCVLHKSKKKNHNTKCDHNWKDFFL